MDENPLDAVFAVPDQSSPLDAVVPPMDRYREAVGEPKPVDMAAPAKQFPPLPDGSGNTQPNYTQFQGTDVKEYIGERIPGYGAAASIVDNVQAIRAANRVRAGEGTAEDRQLLRDREAEQQRLHDRSLGRMILDNVTAAPGAVAEWMLSGGAGAAGRGIAGIAGEGVARTVASPFGIGQVASQATAGAVPDVQNGQVGPEKDIGKAVTDALISKVLSNTAFSAIGGVPGANPVRGVLEGTIKGVGASQAAQEGAYQLDAAKKPSSFRGMLEGDPQAKKEFIAEAAGFLGAETGAKAAHAMMDRAQKLESTGIRPDSEKMRSELEKVADTFTEQAKEAEKPPEPSEKPQESPQTAEVPVKEPEPVPPPEPVKANPVEMDADALRTHIDGMAKEQFDSLGKIKDAQAALKTAQDRLGISGSPQDVKDAQAAVREAKARHKELTADLNAARDELMKRPTATPKDLLKEYTAVPELKDHVAAVEDGINDEIRKLQSVGLKPEAARQTVLQAAAEALKPDTGVEGRPQQADAGPVADARSNAAVRAANRADARQRMMDQLRAAQARRGDQAPKKVTIPKEADNPRATLRDPELPPTVDDQFKQALDVLPERSRAILSDRMSGKSLEDIGKDLGITRERVRQLQGDALKKLNPKTADAVRQKLNAEKKVDADAAERLESQSAKGPTEIGDTSVGPSRDFLDKLANDKLAEIEKIGNSDIAARDKAYMELAEIQKKQSAGGWAVAPTPAGPTNPGGIGDSLRTLLAPGTRQGAEGAGLTLRAGLAVLARKKAIAQEALKKGERVYDALIAGAKDDAERTDRFLQFTDAIEHGKVSALPDDLRPIAETLQKLTAERTKDVVSRELIGTPIDNYMGHLWKKRGSTAGPDEIGQILSARRPLAGKEGFRKQRTLPTFRDGINEGLEPVSWNPVTLGLMKLHEIDKSVMAHDVVQELTANGLWSYVRLGGKTPEGWQKISDKIATVYAPGEARIKEYFDKQQMEGLESFAKSLGIDVKTGVTGRDVLNLGIAGGLPKPVGNKGGGPLGASFGDTVVRRFGTPEEILAHEIGHQLDSRYGMAKALQSPPLQAEMTALADLRASGRVSQEYRDYLQQPNEQAANLVAAYLHAPELLQKVAPHSAQWFDAMINSHKELQPLRDIKPSLELGQRDQMLRLAGPILMGHYYTPEPVATLLNNHLSPGLYGKSKVFDAVRESANILNQFQLGFSFFHAGFVALDTQTSAVALGLKMMSRGDVTGGLAKLAGAPFSPMRNYIQGSKVMKEYYSPGSQGAETAAVVDSHVQGGGRATMDAFYGGTQFEKFRKALTQVGAGQYSKIGNVLYHALPALSEAFSKPVMENLVPRMKMGVMADLTRYEMEKNPGMSPEQYRSTLAKNLDSVENRLGQLTYDNLFWNRTLKDLLMVGVRSVGWNVGTVRELGGGVKDIPRSLGGIAKGEGVTNRAAYLVALPIVTGLYGAIYQYLATGKGPDDHRDYFFPKTGTKRKDGSDDRMSLPSYMRDVAGLTNRADEGPLRTVSNVWGMAKHKLNPLVSLTSEMLNNEDFHGKAIYDPKDSTVQKARDLAMHIIQSAEPFAVRNLREQQGKGVTPEQAAQGFIGVTPAPAYVTRTAEQQRAIESAQKITMSPLQKLRKDRQQK